MRWLVVYVIVAEAEKAIENVVNIDTIVRVWPSREGAGIRFVDGSVIQVSDKYQEVCQLLREVEKINGQTAHASHGRQEVPAP